MLRHQYEFSGLALAAIVGALLIASLGWTQSPPPGPPPGPMAGPGAADSSPPLIDAVSYSGNHRISTAKLEKESVIKLGAPISRALVGDEIRRVIALYKQAGLDLSISPNIQHPAAGHVTVEFQINEEGKGGDSGAAPAGGAAGGGPPPGGGSPHP